MHRLTPYITGLAFLVFLPNVGVSQEEYSIPDFEYDFAETLLESEDEFSLGADLDLPGLNIDATMRSLDFSLQDAVVQSIESWAGAQDQVSIIEQGANPVPLLIMSPYLFCKEKGYPKSLCSFINSIGVARLRWIVAMNIWFSDYQEVLYLQNLGSRNRIELSIELFRNQENIDSLLNADLLDFQERAQEFHTFRTRFSHCVGSLLDPVSAITCPSQPLR